MPLLHQPQQLALGDDGVFQVEARELVLPRHGLRGLHFLEQPVVDGPVVHELQRAQRVGDVLDGVGEAVGEVVHRVDAPLRAGAVVVRPADAVEDGVPHDHVGRRHVDTGTHHMRSVRELSRAHAAEEVEALLHRTIPPGARAPRLRHRAPVGADLLLVQAVHVGRPFLDKPDGVVVELLEVVGGVPELAPFEAQPADVLLDGLHIAGLFGLRVGVVEAQVAGAPVLGGDPEVEADGLGVANVQQAVGLGREASGHPAAVLVARQIRGHDLADEVAPRYARTRAHMAFPCFTTIRARFTMLAPGSLLLSMDSLLPR